MNLSYKLKYFSGKNKSFKFNNIYFYFNIYVSNISYALYLIDYTTRKMLYLYGKQKISALITEFLTFTENNKRVNYFHSFDRYKFILGIEDNNLIMTANRNNNYVVDCFNVPYILKFNLNYIDKFEDIFKELKMIFQ